MGSDFCPGAAFQRLAGEVAAIATKLAELTAAAQGALARRPASLPPSEASRRRSWWPWRRAG